MYGRVGKGNVMGNGTYRTESGPVRKSLCRACGRTFSERSNTAFFNLRSEDRKILLALNMIPQAWLMQNCLSSLRPSREDERGREQPNR